MKKETLHPKFPEIMQGTQACWGQGDNICMPTPVATIPVFEFYTTPTEKSEREKEYWEQKEKEYQSIKNLYEANCYVGTIFKGNSSCEAKITKIHIDTERAYIRYRPSDKHVAEVEEYNKLNEIQLKPLKPGRFSLHGFLSMVASGHITVLSNPILRPKK